MNLAPIVLFVYNRPWHTQQTLEALLKNNLATESDLFIYSDGPRNETSIEQVNEVRNYIKTLKGFKSITIFESEVNKGLADSIIDGVTYIVSKFGKIIVLEDDIVTSAGFLQYMNDALVTYENEVQVMHISGYIFPVKRKLPATFFFNSTSCWGWGTWSRAWKYFTSDTEFLISKINKPKTRYQFNIEDSYDFFLHLQENQKGTMRTWAVKWYASVFLKQGFCLHPYPSLVNNIGFDNFGTNCGKIDIYNWNKLAISINVSLIKIRELKYARKSISLFFKPKKTLDYKLKAILFKIIPIKLYSFVKKSKKLN